MSELILIRGLPGSGKSTLAQKFFHAGYAHFEADMWMVNEVGTYHFDATILSLCHEACQDYAQRAVLAGVNVVVSNTFSRLWEMEPYFAMGARVTVVECQGNFANPHGVPAEEIELMRQRWERF